jgi:hypothetical protein
MKKKQKSGFGMTPNPIWKKEIDRMKFKHEIEEENKE